jgi:hypothetical protein
MVSPGVRNQQVEQSVGQIGPAAETLVARSDGPRLRVRRLSVRCESDECWRPDTVGTKASMVLVGGAVGIGGIAVMLGLDALVMWVL